MFRGCSSRLACATSRGIRLRQLQRQSRDTLPQAGMVIRNRHGNRAGLMRFEDRLQPVMFVAHLIFGHFASSFRAKHSRWRGRREVHLAENSAETLPMR